MIGFVRKVGGQTYEKIAKDVNSRFQQADHQVSQAIVQVIQEVKAQDNDRERIRKFLENFTNSELFSAEIYFLTKLPALVDLSEVSQIVLMAKISISIFFISVYNQYRKFGG